jgi:hypothetical protein
MKKLIVLLSIVCLLASSGYAYNDNQKSCPANTWQKTRYPSTGSLNTNYVFQIYYDLLDYTHSGTDNHLSPVYSIVTYVQTDSTRNAITRHAQYGGYQDRTGPVAHLITYFSIVQENYGDISNINYVEIDLL